MIILKALGLIALIIVPGWLAVSLLENGSGGLDNRLRLFLTAALGMGIASFSALILALVGIYSVNLMLGVIALICLLLAISARGKVLWVKKVELQDLLISLAIITVAIILFAPPWSIVFGWSDVGVYPDIAAHVQREGDVAVVDDVAASVSEENRDLIYHKKDFPFQEDVYFENQFFVIDDFKTGEETPWFYKLWPSFMAVVASFLGIEKLFWAITVMGVLVLWGFCLLARRLLGERYSIAAAVLFVISPLILYFSRYTLSEMMNLALFMAASLCLMAYLGAVDPADKLRLAIAASIFFTLGFLCRIDFLLILLPLGLCYLTKAVLRRLTRADLCFCGLVLTGALLSMIIGYLFSKIYFKSSFYAFFGSWKWLAVAVVLLLGVSLILLFGQKVKGLVGRLAKVHNYWTALLWICLAGLFMYLYFIRPLGEQTTITYGFIKYVEGPGYIKQGFVRWGWYFSVLGLLLIFTGYGTWLTRKRSFSDITIAIMGFVLTLIYAWNMHALPMHILAMRRLLPVIFPVAIIMIVHAMKSLIELAGSYPKTKEGKRWGALAGKIAVFGLLFYFIVFFINTSIPVLGLDEGGNQLELCENIALDSEQGSVIILDYHLGDLFGSPLRCFYGVENAWMKDNSSLAESSFLGLLDDIGFPQRAIYLLWRPLVSGDDVVLTEGLDAEFVKSYHWHEYTLEKSFADRPSRRESLSEQIWLFRIEKE